MRRRQHSPVLVRCLAVTAVSQPARVQAGKPAVAPAAVAGLSAREHAPRILDVESAR